MNKLSIVGIGMACLDIVVRAKELPTWDKGTRLSGIAIEGGGPAATAIVAAQRLGANCGFIGTYGGDRLGDIKLQTMVENGVDTSRMVRQEGPENQVVLVAVQEETGERIFSGFNRSGLELTPKDLDKDYIIQADFLHMDGYHPKAALQAAALMKRAGKKIMLDGSATKGPISDGMINLIPFVDILICGNGFGKALTGYSDLWKAGRAMRSLGPDIVVQTEGVEGSYTCTESDEFHTPAFKVNVIDTTGAGDVFHGAFMVGMLKGWDIRSILRFSTAVAGIKCTQISGRTGIPSFEQTIQFLADRGISAI